MSRSTCAAPWSAAPMETVIAAEQPRGCVASSPPSLTFPSQPFESICATTPSNALEASDLTLSLTLAVEQTLRKR